MIFNVSVRTDIPNYYWDWFLNRLRAGEVMVRNPHYPEKVSVYSLLSEDVDCFCFLSKNYYNVLTSQQLSLEALIKLYPCQFSYTITPYGKDIEPNVPDMTQSVAMLQELSRRVGKEKIIWRYDPILFTNSYDLNYHKQAFEYLAYYMAPYINYCAFNFINLYDKVHARFPEAYPGDRITQETLLLHMGAVGQKYNMRIQSCIGQDYRRYGIVQNKCMTLRTLEQVLGVPMKDVKHKDDCLMCGRIETRDLGRYDTCLNLCRYCYANGSKARVVQNTYRYDPCSPMLLDELRPGDIVSRANQKRYKIFEL